MSARAQRLEAAVAARELDALLLTNGFNVAWATGFTGSSAAAIVGPDRREFYTDFRYLTQSAEEVPKEFKREIASDLVEGVAKSLAGAGAMRLGFDDGHVTVKAHAHFRELLADEIELVPAAGIVEELRAIKEPEEIDAIRAAARLADAALTAVLERGIVGRTERDVALDLEIEMRRAGAQSASFPSIIAAGPHGALPHAEPRDVEIPANTLVVIDWGARLDGYCSDCTRTVATGELDSRDRAVYDLVLAAQEAALQAVRPGPTGREVDAVAREIITAGGYGEHFGHGLGHGVGLEVHEAPRLAVTGDTALAAGQVVTVEPGVYMPGAVGVRIEDLVAITTDGCEILTAISKDLTTVS